MTVEMVDISEKPSVARTATAAGRILLKSESLEAIRSGRVKKGDVLATAQVAGILAAKKAAELIPLCHPIPVTKVEVELEVESGSVRASSTVSAVYSTGVEMEALTGTSVALLTVWDMVKYIEKDELGQYPSTRITDLRVVSKRKGNA